MIRKIENTALETQTLHFLYTNLGITGDDKNVYVTNVCDSNEWIYFILKSGENEHYYCLNTLNGEISNVLFDNNKKLAEKNI